MAAEAAVEVDRLDDALNWVNQVRNRAKNMTYLQAWEFEKADPLVQPGRINNPPFTEVAFDKDENPLTKPVPGVDAANYEIEPYPAFPDKEYARKAVRFERRLELGVEGHRLFDLRRWDQNDPNFSAANVINAYRVNEARVIEQFDDQVNPYEDRFNLFPIPVEAIDLSGGVPVSYTHLRAHET